MYLKKLQITNFRYFKKYEVEFAPHVTVLFGKNGSGKTTLIHALHKALSFMMYSEKIKIKDPKTRTEANGFSFDVSQNDHGLAIHICLMDNHDRT